MTDNDSDDTHDDLTDAFNYASHDRLPYRGDTDAYSVPDDGPNIVERHGDDLAIAYTVRRADGEVYLELENEPDELSPWDWRFHRKFNDLVGDEPIPETPTQDDDIGIVVRRPFADEFAAGESVEWDDALERATGALAPAFEAMVEAVGEAIDAIARGDGAYPEGYDDEEDDESDAGEFDGGHGHVSPAIPTEERPRVAAPDDTTTLTFETVDGAVEELELEEYSLEWDPETDGPATGTGISYDDREFEFTVTFGEGADEDE